jgi:tetratricopeptide (TPR) repeat protein
MIFIGDICLGEAKPVVSFLYCFEGNGYFKQKRYSEAIDCYSRSIGLSPTAVAFANRAMAYLKLRRRVTI